MNTDATLSVSSPPAEEGRTAAILSYVTVVGFVMALVLHRGGKTRFGAFHLRQTLGLYLVGAVLGVAGWYLLMVPGLGILFVFAAWVAWFVVWAAGLSAAMAGLSRPVPVVGDAIEKRLGRLFE